MRICSFAKLVAAALVCSVPRTASAWYFPEHAELTRIGLEHYASPAVAEVMQEAIDALRVDLRFAICPDVGLPFASTPLASESAACAARAACIPYAALPALAADHSLSAEDLWRFLSTDSPGLYAADRCRADMSPAALASSPPPGLVAARIVGASVETWREFKRDAPVEFARAFEAFVPGTGGAQIIDRTISRRRLVRELDARLLLVDHDYSDRAAGSKAHFANAMKSVGDAMDELKSVGNTDNALGQMLAHQMRAMLIAVRSRGETEKTARAGWVALALLEHAFAVHFMQDAFAAWPYCDRARAFQSHRSPPAP